MSETESQLVKEKMQNNYLVVPNSKNEVLKLKGSKILFPLKSFSVGFNSYFDLEEITYDNSYLYINRLLSSSDIDLLKKKLDTISDNIKGIVFEDLGILEIIKNLNIEKIFFSSHILTNAKSINEYLKHVDSCVISPDITINEVNDILKNSNKKLCLYGFGHLPLSYSRRLLNTNYAKIYNLSTDKNLYIKNTGFEFIVNENEFGSVTYDKEIFSGLEETYEENVLYYIINLFEIGLDNFFNSNLNVTKGFLEKETFYKLKEKK